MKKLLLIGLSGMLIGTHEAVNAQWTRNAGTQQTYTTFTGDNVGIGTTAPAFKLDVQGTGVTTMSFKSATNNASILLDRGSSNSTSSLTYRSQGTNVWQTGIIANSNYQIRNNALATAALSILSSNSNVGIGTTNPETRLQVGSYTSGAVDQFITVATQGGNLFRAGLKLRHFQNNLGWDLYSDERAGFQGLWLNQVVSGVNTNRMFIDYYTGNIGIGTSAPTAQLQTTGTVRHEGLSGNSNRMVFSDPLGNLLTGPQLISSSVNTNNNFISFPGQDGSGICIYDSSNIIISGLPILVNSSSISIKITASSSLWMWLKAPNGELLGIINGNPPRLFTYENDVFSDTAALYYPYNYGPPSEKIGNSWKPDGSVTSYCYNSIDPTVSTFGALGGGTINPNGVWTLYVSVNGLGGTGNLSDWSVNFSDISGTGINNFVPKWQSGNLTISSNIYDDGINVGIGTSAPDAKLVVAGTVKIADGTQGAGKVLTSDANGFASWVTPAPFAKQGDGNWTEEQQKEIKAKDEVIKNLQSTVGNLQNRLNEMQQCVESLCNNSSSQPKAASYELQASSSLFQNQPNPFNQTTVIRYTLSSEANSGKIIIRDLNGNLVKQVSIAQSGKGQVTINANELAQGTYTYTLEIGAESVDTKLMVINK